MQLICRQVLYNAVRLATKMEPGESITREELIDAVRMPVIASDIPTSLLSDFNHLFIERGVRFQESLVDYETAALLSGSTVGSLKVAASRGQLVKLGRYDSQGRSKTVITLQSLADWKRWDTRKFEQSIAVLRKQKI